jgi:hypothetical protein
MYCPDERVEASKQHASSRDEDEENQEEDEPTI